MKAIREIVLSDDYVITTRRQENEWEEWQYEV